MTPYWEPRPVEPWHDWRTYSIGIPILFSAIGATLFMALAFSFTELGAIPATVRMWLVVIGAFSTAFGSCFGSIGSGVEVFRKVFAKTVSAWDWISLSLSACATLCGFVLGFAAVLEATETWSAQAQIYGPLAISFFVALDALGDLIEFGGLFASYGTRMEQWRQDEQGWNEAHGIVTVDRANWRTATIKDARLLAQSLNGESEHVTSDNLQKWFDGVNLKVPHQSESTKARWAEVLKGV